MEDEVDVPLKYIKRVTPVCSRCNWLPATHSTWTVESL